MSTPTTPALDSARIEDLIERYQYHLTYSLAKDEYSATERDKYYAFALVIREKMIKRWMKTQQTYYSKNVKRVYYLSLEFLIGRSMGNALLSLGFLGEAEEACRQLGLDIENLRNQEVDAGLGNGGLGRLAACFLDSLATLQLPAHGYGIRYEYGIFHQKIKNGEQVEEPDYWLRNGNPWETERPENSYTIRFYGNVTTVTDDDGNTRSHWENTENVLAVPYDVPVPGYQNNTVNSLRLWSAKSTDEFNLAEFNKGHYMDAMEEKNRWENIAKVLYPNDETESGKELRLQQQYFFVSASLQDIIRRFIICNSDDGVNVRWQDFPDKVAVQLNDTHPTMAVPELMRLFLDKYALDWHTAWDLTRRTFGFTNHTLLPEALEKWSLGMMQHMFPRHMEIIYRINYDFLGQVNMRWPGDMDRLSRMSIIDEQGGKFVRMANLAIVGSHSVNGVAALHTQLLQENLFRDFYEFCPEKFNNKTNGITQRRWLLKSNPLLSEHISSAIGDEWITDLYKLKGLEKFTTDRAFKERWVEIKRENKIRLAEIIYKDCGVMVSPESMFDVQVKRLHEYKRQLMFALHIVASYLEIKDNPSADVVPRTCIFGAKAAPGYHMAKLIIKFINNIAGVINNDPQIGDKLKVVFLPNYRVSLAENIFPASDLSEQISTAGKEASGTGNMKFALNGALTIGTWDGANIEIAQEVGEDNIFIFGKRVEEIHELWAGGYNPRSYYESDPLIKRVLDLIANDFFSREQKSLFKSLVDSLLYHDTYCLLADFQSYRECQARVSEAYRNVDDWTARSILNVARQGKFSTDRTIREYTEDIWGAQKCEIELD
jgi:starch phosphorylase